MAEERIVITIDEEGKIKAESSGFVGSTCLEELEVLLENSMLPEKIVPTDEYYQEDKGKVKLCNKKK